MLNEENATGLNPEMAHKNIMEFESAIWKAHSSLEVSFVYLFYELQFLWASKSS